MLLHMYHWSPITNGNYNNLIIELVIYYQCVDTKGNYSMLLLMVIGHYHL